MLVHKYQIKDHVTCDIIVFANEPQGLEILQAQFWYSHMEELNIVLAWSILPANA